MTRLTRQGIRFTSSGPAGWKQWARDAGKSRSYRSLRPGAQRNAPVQALHQPLRPHPDGGVIFAPGQQRRTDRAGIAHQAPHRLLPLPGPTG